MNLCPINMPKLEFRSDSDLFGDSRWLINPDMMMGEEEDFFPRITGNWLLVDAKEEMMSKAKVTRISRALCTWNAYKEKIK